MLLVLAPLSLPPLQTKTNHHTENPVNLLYSRLPRQLVDALRRRKAGRSQEGSRIRPWDFWFSILDLLLQLEAGAELASGELEYVQEPEQEVVEQQLPSATPWLGLPPPVRMGEELDFGCAVGFGEAAAVER